MPLRPLLRLPRRLPTPLSPHLNSHSPSGRMSSSSHAHAHPASPPTPAFLASLAADARLPPDTWYLLAAATCTTLGRAPAWLPAIYAHAVAPLGPAPASPTPAPESVAADPLPRRRVVRRLKECLVKGAILHGVPHAIGASLVLKDALAPGDRDDSFVREGLGVGGAEDERRGREALHRIYRDEMPLVGERRAQMRDVEWLSYNVTYGIFLAPVSDTCARAPLSVKETEVVVLSCLLALRAEMEVRWHLRGSLWVGLSEQEVEGVQRAVERVAWECAGVDCKSGMPRVGEVARAMREREAEKEKEKEKEKGEAD